jgi:uncharacterized protein DUF4013
LDRVTDAFAWPVRDPEWPVKVLIVGLTLLIPIAGAINGLGWMLATLDRLRAGEERLAPANLGYLGRGIRLFAVQLVYSLAVAVVGLLFYLPGLLIAIGQGRGSGNATLILVSLFLNVVAFGVTTIGSLALTFATPAIVLATDRGGIRRGLSLRQIARRSRANPTNTLIAGLMLIAAGLISSLGAIVCLVGVVFTAAYALAVQAWVYRSFESGSNAATQAAS